MCKFCVNFQSKIEIPTAAYVKTMNITPCIRQNTYKVLVVLKFLFGKKFHFEILEIPEILEFLEILKIFPKNSVIQ